METLKNILGGTLLAVFAFLWTFGGAIGAIIMALRNDLLGVVLCVFIPGYGALMTVIAAWEAIR